MSSEMLRTYTKLLPSFAQMPFFTDNIDPPEMALERISRANCSVCGIPHSPIIMVNNTNGMVVFITASPIRIREKPEDCMTTNSLRLARLPKAINAPNKAAMGKNVSTSFGIVNTV